MPDNQQLNEAIATGMQVHDAHGEPVGLVKEVRQRDMLVDRRLRRDLFVPLSAVDSVVGGVVTLSVANDAIGALDWDKPSPLGALQEDPLVAPGRDIVSRDVLGATGDAERDTPLDTRPGRGPLAGTDDGALPPAEDLLQDDEQRVQRLRDMAG